MSERWRRVGTWSAVAALIGGAVVAFIAIHNASSSPPLEPVSVVPPAARAGDRVPRIVLRSVDGRRVSVPGTGAGAIAFVDASTCRRCARTAKALSRLGHGVRPILVDLDWRDRRSVLDRFLRAAGRPRYPVVLDTATNAIGSAFSISTAGTVLVYRPGGRIVATFVHPTAARLAHAAVLAR